MKPIASNKKAFFDYQILEKFEAGLVLTGQEIKAIRKGKISLKGAHARVLMSQGKPEAWLINAHIADTNDPSRTRKLLLHKTEISKLIGKTQEKGLTLLLLSIYLKRGFAKVELGLGKGKKLHDKREVIKQRDIERELKRKLK